MSNIKNSPSSYLMSILQTANYNFIRPVVLNEVELGVRQVGDTGLITVSEVEIALNERNVVRVISMQNKKKNLWSFVFPELSYRKILSAKGAQEKLNLISYDLFQSNSIKNQEDMWKLAELFVSVLYSRHDHDAMRYILQRSDTSRNGIKFKEEELARYDRFMKNKYFLENRDLVLENLLKPYSKIIPIKSSSSHFIGKKRLSSLLFEPLDLFIYQVAVVLENNTILDFIVMDEMVNTRIIAKTSVMLISGASEGFIHSWREASKHDSLKLQLITKKLFNQYLVQNPARPHFSFRLKFHYNLFNTLIKNKDSLISKIIDDSKNRVIQYLQNRNDLFQSYKESITNVSFFHDKIIFDLKIEEAKNIQKLTVELAPKTLEVFIQDKGGELIKIHNSLDECLTFHDEILYRVRLIHNQFNPNESCDDMKATILRHQGELGVLELDIKDKDPTLMELVISCKKLMTERKQFLLNKFKKEQSQKLRF